MMLQQLRRARRAQGGFTLIELLLVIVILGILAAVVVFAVGGIDDKGKKSACKADVHNVTVAAEAYNVQNGRYAAGISDLVRTGLLRSAPSSSAYQVDYQLSGDGKSVSVSSSYCPTTEAVTTAPTTVVAAPYCEQLRTAVKTYGGLDLNALDEVGYGGLIKTLNGLAGAQPKEAGGIWTTFVNTYSRAHQLLVDAGLQWGNLSALLRGEVPKGMSDENARALTEKLSSTLNSSAQQEAYGTMINTSGGICGGDIFN
jgi:prepilin-type N-terminal cleavage/methylation domain-containing protein